MADEEHKVRRVTYWGFTQGITSAQFYGEELDMEHVLDDLEQRGVDERVLRFEKSNVALAADVFKRAGDPERTLVFLKGHAIDLIKVMRNDKIETVDLKGGELLHSSWVRFHPGNRVGILRGPGGPGKGDLVRYLNGLEPPLLAPPPKLKKDGTPASASPWWDSRRCPQRLT